jgi:hypothetical protein
VTTVRDMGNTGDVVETRRRFDRGELLGPRMVLAGFIDRKGPFAAPTGTLVETEAEALQAVRRYAEQGYAQIKLYSSLDTAWVAPIVREAHARGLRVSGHIPVHLSAEQAVAKGFDEIQHVNFLVLNFLPDTLDTRTPARFHAPAAYAAGLDLDGERVRRFVDLLRDRRVVLDPTVGIFEELYASRAGEPAPGAAPVLDRFPVQLRRVKASGVGGLQAPVGMEETYRASYRQMLAFVRRLHEAGVRIVAGTDAWPPGFALHRELELYEAAGIPARDVLRLATWTAAEVAGVSDTLGAVEAGRLADLILVDGRPDRQVRDIRNIDLVVKGGVLYDPAALYPAYGYAPRR